MTAPPDQHARTRGAGLRVLLVEDDADAAETFSQLLELAGHIVSVRHEGRDALACALQEVFDAVLCDVGLDGEFTGRDVARALRSEHAGGGPLLVAISGLAGPEEEERSLTAGFDAHLTKPVDRSRLDRLLALVRPALKG